MTHTSKTMKNIIKKKRKKNKNHFKSEAGVYTILCKKIGETEIKKLTRIIK